MAAQAEMMAAIAAGDQEKVAALAARDARLAEARDEKGVSAVMQALYHRRPEMVRALLAARPALDIFEATAVGRAERVRELLKADARLAQAWSADGFTALHFAGFFGQGTTGKILIEHGADTAAVARNPMQVMPLHSAASTRNLAMAEALLAHGAPVNARQTMGWTPLHAAAQNGDRAMIALLLKHGADVQLKNDAGVNAMELARKGGHLEIVELLSK